MRGSMVSPAFTLLLFSLLMVAVPLATFYSALHGRLDGLLQPLLGPQALADSRLPVAGGLAVLAVNVVLAAFVAAAWLEAPPPPKAAAKKD